MVENRTSWIDWWDNCIEDLKDLGISDNLSTDDIHYISTPSTLDLHIPVSLKDHDFPTTIRRSFHSLNVINDYWIRRPWDTR